MTNTGIVNEETEEVAAAGAVVATFDEFCSCEYRRILRLGFALTGSQSTAEELAQETMLRVFSHWSRVAQLDHPDAWARRVLLNLVNSRGRRLKSEAKALVRLRGDRRNAAAPSLDNAVVRPLPRAPRHPRSPRQWRSTTSTHANTGRCCGSRTC